MFGVPAGGCSSFAIGAAAFGALAAGGPEYIADFKMPIVADPAQYLPGRTAAQMLQEPGKRGEPELYPAAAVVSPLYILGIPALSFCVDVGYILGRATTAVDPAAIGAEGAIGGSFAKSFSFAHGARTFWVKSFGFSKIS